MPDPAPALTRGLMLLRILAQDGPSTLDQLARKAAIPKSSALRLIEALIAAGIAERDGAAKRIRALQILAPADRAGPSFRDAAQPSMDALCTETAQTVELFAFRDGQLIMVDRIEPESGEVRAVARIGHQRDLTEVDALSCLVLAHGLPPNQWPKGRPWVWKAGRKTILSSAQRQARVAAAAQEGWASDPDFNGNGVRRVAAPLWAAPGSGCGALAGALAVAQTWTPDAERRAASYPAAVRRHAERASLRLSTRAP